MFHWQPAKCCIFQLFIIICYLAAFTKFNFCSLLSYRVNGQWSSTSVHSIVSFPAAYTQINAIECITSIAEVNSNTFELGKTETCNRYSQDTCNLLALWTHTSAETPHYDISIAMRLNASCSLLTTTATIKLNSKVLGRCETLVSRSHNSRLNTLHSCGGLYLSVHQTWYCAR